MYLTVNHRPIPLNPPWWLACQNPPEEKEVGWWSVNAWHFEVHQTFSTGKKVQNPRIKTQKGQFRFNSTRGEFQLNKVQKMRGKSLLTYQKKLVSHNNIGFTFPLEFSFTQGWAVQSALRE